MDARERLVATLTFQRADRVPFSPGAGRQSTLAAWHCQGLPPAVNDYHAYVRETLGIPAESHGPHVVPGVNFRMIPEFEELVLERRPAPSPGARGTLIVQDWKGNVCEISDQYDTRYLRDAIDFVTRRWVRCPVRGRADWPDMARRYKAADPGRLPADYPARAAALSRRKYVSVLNFPGPFWQLREWLGFEGLCLLLLDDPAFAQEMIEFWQGFIAQLLARVLPHYVPDMVTISEDMAYKQKAMISPAMVRRFLLPCWRAWVDQCRAAGVPIIEMDCDGYVGELIPMWIEAGINCNSPLEVAAGNDLPAYRRRYGTQMAYRGGVDKRAIAAGGEVLRAEMARLRPVIQAGGYIPGCDHGIPPDVRWPDFTEYCRLLAEATGWLPLTPGQ